MKKTITNEKRYEAFRYIQGYGKIRILFWYYMCPRLQITKVYKTGREVHPYLDFNKSIDLLKSLIVDDEYSYFTVYEDAIDKVEQAFPALRRKN